jgi:hypothetical protein
VSKGGAKAGASAAPANNNEPNNAA